MKLWFNKNVLDRIIKIKNEFETTTQFIYRAVENYVLQMENEKKNDRKKKE
jgi:hypothetical protein